LLDAGHHEPSLGLLHSLFEQCSTHQQAQELLARMRNLPPDLMQHPTARRLYVQTLCRARQPEEILRLLAPQSPDPALRVYQAWAQVRQGQYQQALHTLEEAAPATKLDWSIFYRTKGEALFWTGAPDWLEVFDQARAYLQGSALGRMLLDRGWFLNHLGKRSAAVVCWGEALAYLEHDPYYQAWAHNNLGFAMLNDQPHKAEQHLLEALRLSRKETARAFRAQALMGLGAVRRGLGEWERALDSYRQALRFSSDSNDKHSALWGWGHTLRLMGRVEEALPKLIQARQLQPQEVWLEADLAAAHLMLGEQESVLKSLPWLQSLRQERKLSERGQVVLKVVEAELARRQGNLPQAQKLLAGLNPQNLWVREELGCFPALTQMRGLAPQTERFRVEVEPFGRLEVRVNGRPVPIPAVSKMGELLVFMLVQGKQASLELLVDRLGKPHSKNPRKALWENIEKLRQALGWKESIQSCGGVYRLDPRAEWICDLEPKGDPFPTAEDPAQIFMPGYYSEWVEEWRQQWLVV
jgi:tetratricopeptide (TPR) repeat protein